MKWEAVRLASPEARTSGCSAFTGWCSLLVMAQLKVTAILTKATLLNKSPEHVSLPGAALFLWLHPPLPPSGSGSLNGSWLLEVKADLPSSWWASPATKKTPILQAEIPGLNPVLQMGNWVKRVLASIKDHVSIQEETVAERAVTCHVRVTQRAGTHSKGWVYRGYTSGTKEVGKISRCSLFVLPPPPHHFCDSKYRSKPVSKPFLKDNYTRR